MIHDMSLVNIRLAGIVKDTGQPKYSMADSMATGWLSYNTHSSLASLKTSLLWYNQRVETVPSDVRPASTCAL